jgi:hypothetical protein
MSIIHDIHCTSGTCVWENLGVHINAGKFPPCPECGSATAWTPAGFSSDVLTHYSIAGGREFTSTREKDKFMAARGFVPAGDPVGGALNQEHMNLGKSFSYSGQTTRRTLERRR